MNKAKITTILILTIIAIITIGLISSVNATGKINPSDYKPSDITTNDYQTAFDKTKKVMTVITSVGISLSVIMTIYLGIRYMLSSVEQKAEFKKTAIPMFVGVILLFSISVIVKLMYVVMKDFNV